MNTPNDRFLTGSLTGSFWARPTTGSPVPSPTGTGTGRSGSSTVPEPVEPLDRRQHPEPITATSKDQPMGSQQTPTIPSVQEPT